MPFNVSPINRISHTAGDRFGTLTTTGNSKSIEHRVYWQCICDCGKSLYVFGKYLRSGQSRSCGCSRFKKLIPGGKRGSHRSGNPTHGMSKSREARCWSGMKSRCYNANCKDYPHYGGRGIRVCDRWRSSFKNFLADMGSKPSPKHSIERIDNNGNYEPSNCRWATHEEQVNNRRANARLLHGGKTLTISEWGRLTGISRMTIRSRLNRGWTVGEALSVKPDRNNKNIRNH